MLPDISHEPVFEQSTVDDLLQREKNGRPLLNRLFEIYLEETPRLLDELSTALEERNAEDVYDAVHQMKGSASALGARKLFRLTEAALGLCRDERILEVDNLVDRLQDESDTFIREIRAILSERG